MSKIKQHSREHVCLKGALAFCLLVFIIAGCASEPMQFDDNIKGAQLIVEPATFHLGVAWMLGTDIVFQGKGFAPGENFCVELTGDEDVNRDISVPICCGLVDDSGNFSEKAKTLVKAGYLLNADVATGKKGYLIIINQPPVPEGAYLATAKGYDSSTEARSPITIRGPSLKDRLVDWIARLLGKVKKE